MQRTLDLKSLRARLGWTQDQMADHLGIDRSSVSHIENGRQATGPVRKLIERLDAEAPAEPASVPSRKAKAQHAEATP